MERKEGSYTLSTGIYRGVSLEGPKDFWDNFDEAIYRKMGYGGGPGGIVARA